MRPIHRILLLALLLIPVMLLTYRSKQDLAETPLPAPTPVPLSNLDAAPQAPFEAILNKAMAAYNEGNSKAFWADAARTAVPAPTTAVFTNLYAGYYRREFGRLISKELLHAETRLDPNFGVLVYLAQFENRSRAKLSANFTRESGALKLVQVRFE